MKTYTKREGDSYVLDKEKIITLEDTGRGILTKLGSLEEEERRLGVDLLTREKALQYGCWYKSKSRGIIFCPLVRLVGSGKVLELRQSKLLRTPTLLAKTCDYGSTWSLKREDLGRTYIIVIMSENPECNQEKGPFTTIDKARKAALKWKGKYDYYGFRYEYAYILTEGKEETVEIVELNI